MTVIDIEESRPTVPDDGLKTGQGGAKPAGRGEGLTQPVVLVVALAEADLLELFQASS